MKAELNENGVLTVTPETPTEAYAINHWVNEAWVPQGDLMRNESGHIRGSKIIVNGLVPNSV